MVTSGDAGDLSSWVDLQTRQTPVCIEDVHPHTNLALQACSRLMQEPALGQTYRGIAGDTIFLLKANPGSRKPVTLGRA